MYTIQTLDPVSKDENDGLAWRTRYKRKTPRATVRCIWLLESMGYDRDISISVEKAGWLEDLQVKQGQSEFSFMG